METSIMKARNPRSRGERFKVRFRNEIELQSMVWLGLVFLVVFSYIPMYGILMAFQDYNFGDVPGFSPWVGLDHFRLLVQDRNVLPAVRNTLIISVLKLIFNFPAPIILALLVNEIQHASLRRSIQTVSYLPHFISWVVGAGLVLDLLRLEGGSINELLMWLGIMDEEIYFMGNPQYFWPILVVSDLWKEVGWNSIIYFAAISSISEEIYEASSIDGAGRFQKIFYITLPSLKPTISILLIFAVGGMLNSNFDQIMLLTNRMTNPQLIGVGNVIDTYIYRTGISNGRYSYSTAMELLKSVLNFGLLFAANQLAKLMNEETVI